MDLKQQQVKTQQHVTDLLQRMQNKYKSKLATLEAKLSDLQEAREEQEKLSIEEACAKVKVSVEHNMRSLYEEKIEK